MRNLIYLTLVIYAFSSCDNSEAAQIENIMNGPNDNSIISSKLKAKDEILSYSVHCSGTCSSGQACALEGVLYIGGDGTEEEYVQCKCDNCVMHITYETGESPQTEEEKQQLIDNLNNKYLFLEELEEFVATYYSGIAYDITSIELQELGNTYILLYDIVTANNNVESVMYAYLNVDGPDEEKLEIDCTGGCSDPNALCRERYVITTGSVECTCEGSCKMTLTKLSKN